MVGCDCLQANNPNNSSHAGATLLISTKIEHLSFANKSNQHIQIVATSININSIPISIVSAYFPPGPPLPAEYLSLFLQTLNHTHVIGADFHAKHESSFYRSKNLRDYTLHNCIINKCSKCIYPASHQTGQLMQTTTPTILIFFYLISPITSIKMFLT